MPGLDGLGVIRKLREKDIPLPYFVMATAYDQYAVEAFRWEALDYLLKPIEKDRLAMADRARAQRRRGAPKTAPPELPPPKPTLQRTKLLVKSNQRNFIVDAQEVVYATIEDGLITVVASNLEGQSNYRTIEELQSNLDPEPSGACTGPIWSTFIASRKWCRGSNPASSSAWTIRNKPRSRSAASRPSACARC